MIWFTWRLHRTQVYAGLALVALVAAVFLPYGEAARASFASHGVGACLARDTGGEPCQTAMRAFIQEFNGIANHLSTWFSPIPGLIGAIIGAGVLGREYEQGTWRLAWTQSVPRGRWLTQRILLVAAGITAISLTLSQVFTWFRSPVDEVSGRFAPGAFDLEGLSLTGYTLFAFALGVLAGLVLRRTVPAIVVAFAGFMAVRMPVEFWVRQRFQTPASRLSAPTLQHTFGPSSVPVVPGKPGWTLGYHLVDGSGRTLTTAEEARLQTQAQAAHDPDAYLRGLGLHLRTVYQPADRFWTFQFIEFSVFAGLALVLLALAVHRLRRRGA
ncbi:ABC transporter permease subunit [Actinomadura oligospora]|uniref:ABC transporter permease subunit n=1 Tax=Actinomadura oligospora TaxID=111804 RepID=UPI00047EE027|nr:ABC transporter permease subunit [Actinomadura oligospora]